MYRAMLVDDEILVRERISKRIPWGELGYELAAVCENGKEAIEVLEKEKVDLILTDICMPYVDGLELTKYVNEKELNTKVIILSGYDEFSYAQKAVRYKVLSYVLKPVTSAELKVILTEAKEKLDEDKAQEQVRSVYLGSLEILKSQFLMQLALGNVSKDGWEEKCTEYGICFEGEQYCALTVIPRERFSEDVFIQLLGWIAENSSDALAFEGTEGNLVLFVKQCNNRLLVEEARRLCLGLVEYAWKKFRHQLSCLIGNCVADLSEISFSYQNALKLGEFLYLEKEDHLYEWDFFEKQKWDIGRMAMDKEREQRVILAVKGNLKEELKKELQEFGNECRKLWITRNRAVITYQSMIFAVMSSVVAQIDEEEELFLREQECILTLFKCTYLSEMEEIVIRFFAEAADILNSGRTSNGERQAAMALAFIEKHYDDSELSLGLLCQKLAISVSYFSTVFKEYAGKTFVEALTEKRMERAKELLQNDDLKMYEVAQRCGYRDSNYFGATFKKTYGMTPREYVRTYGKG